MTAGDVTAFFSNDPREGAKAVAALSQKGLAGLEAVLPADAAAAGSSSPQVQIRLVQLARNIGPESIDLLIDRIEHGPWFTKVLAAPTFAAFQGDDRAQTGLAAVARRGDIDAQRLALESLGYVSKRGYAGFARDIALFGRADISAHLRPDSYTFGKLGRYGALAILMMFARSGSHGQLEMVEELADKADELLSGGQSFDYDIDAVMARLGGSVAADPLIEHWLGHKSERFRRAALVGLGSLRMRRTSDAVAAVIGMDASPTVEVAAGIALGEVIDRHAADIVARLLREGVSSPGLYWAFSILFALEADWPEAVPITECLGDYGDVHGQILLTLGLKKDARKRVQTERGLYDSRPWLRATSALALSRLLGSDAAPLLSRMADEGATEVERIHALAAMVHAGRRDVGERLHAELRTFVQLSQLRRCWKRELLSAVELVNGRGDAELWAEIAGEPLDRVNDDLALLTGAAPAAQPLEGEPASARSAATVKRHATIAPDEPELPRIFISYSRKDSAWLDRFLRMLRPATRADLVDIWSDTRIGPGDLWLQELERAMQLASVAVFLVSSSFLASDFIQRKELPPLMAAAEGHGLKILWVALSPALHELSPLSRYQSANDPSRPLSKLIGAKREEAVADISRKILDAARSSLTPTG